MFALELIFGIGSTALVWANMPALRDHYKEQYPSASSDSEDELEGETEDEDGN